MDFFNLLKQRKSIRKYLPHNISNDLINELLNAAALSPSAKNRQPWRFGILRGEKKNKIAEFMLEWSSRDNLEKEFQKRGCESSVRNTAEIIKQAPVLILIFREPDDNWKTGDALSIGAAIEHICLCAASLDLGSLWIRDTAYVEKEITSFVGYPNLELLSAVSVGYPAETPHPRPRKKLDELILFNK